MERPINNIIFDMSNDCSNRKNISTNVLIKYDKNSAGIFENCIIKDIQINNNDDFFNGANFPTITVTLSGAQIQYLCGENTIQETIDKLSSKVIEKEVIKEVTVIKEIEPIILTYKDIIQMYFDKYRFMI